MVIRTAKNGLTWIGLPLTPEEQAALDRAAHGPPIAIYRRRETPDTGSQPPAAPGSEEKPQTPERR